MGQVYLARDTRLNRLVALKFIQPDLVRVEEIRRRFQREATAAAELTHPGLASIHDYQENDGRPFLVLEYVDGDSLAVLLEPGPLPADRVMALARGLLPTLKFIHDRGFVHRDVKSANILLERKGGVKLLDLGLTKELDDSRVTRAGMITGSVAYMSPEQVSDDGVDRRSDLWSFGVVLYECLTGRLPFAAESNIAAIYRILHESPRPLPDGVPPDLARVVRRCLQKNPEDRYADVVGLMADLEGSPVAAHGGDTHAASGATPAARPVVPAMPVASGATRRVPGGYFIGAAVLIAVLAGAFLLTARRDAETTGPPPRVVLAILPFRDLAPEADPISSAEVTALLHAGFSRSAGLRILSPEYIADLHRRMFPDGGPGVASDQALSLARKAGAGVFLTGEFRRRDEGAEIVWRLIEPKKGETLGTKVVQGATLGEATGTVVASVFPLIETPGGRPPDPLDPAAAAMAGIHPGAWREYVKGQLQRAQFPGEAMVDFERAIALDSTFAQAYLELGSLAIVNFRMERGIEVLNRAWLLRHRLDPRDRMRLDAVIAVKDGKLPLAVTSYRTILDRWPDDLYSLRDLSYIYWYTNCLSESKEVLERGLDLYPNDVDLLARKARTIVSLGRPEEGIRILRSILREHPRSPEFWDDLALFYLHVGLPDSAETATARIAEYGGSIYLDMFPVWIAYARGNLGGAMDKARALLTKPGLNDEERSKYTVSIYPLPVLSGLLMETGRLKESLAVFRRVFEASSEPGVRDGVIGLALGQAQATGLQPFVMDLYEALSSDPLEGHARFYRTSLEFSRLVDLGETEAAGELLERTRADPEFRSCFQLRVFRRWEAMLALRANRHGDAIRSVEEALRNGVFPGWQHILHHDLLAEALHKSSRPAEAAAIYEDILRRYAGHAIDRYRLGIVYQEMGRKAEAKEQFRLFLDAWSKADPELPQPADARKRMATL